MKHPTCTPGSPYWRGMLITVDLLI